MQSCSQFHNQVRDFINLTAACGYKGDRSGRIRITKFTVLASSLSPYVQPLSLRLLLKQPHIDMCVCVCVCVCPLQLLQTKVAHVYHNENFPIQIPHQAADYLKDTNFAKLDGGTLLNDSLTSNEVTDNKVDQFLISNFRRVLDVVCILLGNSPASEIYTPTFRNTLSVPSFCL